MKHIINSVSLIASVALLLCLMPAYGYSQPTVQKQISSIYNSSNTERKIKAAMVRGLLQFVIWPSKKTHSGTKTSIDVCIVGDNPFGEWINKISERNINGNPVKVNIAKNSKSLNVEFCNILYISKNLQPYASNIINDINFQPILTISDINGFTRFGGMIEFIKRSNKIKFKINNSNAQRANLRINSKLLELSE